MRLQAAVRNGTPRWRDTAHRNDCFDMRFATASNLKRQCLVMDRELYRYQKFLSDIAGQDIIEHGNRVNNIVQHVRDFLRNCTGIAAF